MSRILVVDDDPRQGRLIAGILASAGHAVSVATDVTQAVHLFQATPMDLVITDLVMPVKSGLELLKELRQLESNVPVIMISAGGLTTGGEFLEMAVELGAMGILRKPFGREELLATVNRALS